MKKIAMSFFFLAVSQFAFAETVTMKVDKMHCGGCRDTVDEAVCLNKSLNAPFATCTVTVDSEIKVGTVVMTTKSDKKIDIKKVTEAILAANKKYKVLETQFSQ